MISFGRINMWYSYWVVVGLVHLNRVFSLEFRPYPC